MSNVNLVGYFIVSNNIEEVVRMEIITIISKSHIHTFI